MRPSTRSGHSTRSGRRPRASRRSRRVEWERGTAKRPSDRELIEAAKRARLKAYAPYSKFRVGAAVLTADGQVFTGANVENVSYPVSLCAERVAIHQAVAAGHRDLRTVAVVADGKEPAMPCGACRQVMAEFGVRKVIVATPNGRTRVRSLRQLLAEPFLPERLLGKAKGGRRS